jgi:hypothetical protein
MPGLWVHVEELAHVLYGAMLFRGSNEDTDAFKVVVGFALPKRDGVVGIVFCEGDVGSRETSSCLNVSRFVFVGELAHSQETRVPHGPCGA